MCETHPARKEYITACSDRSKITVEERYGLDNNTDLFFVFQYRSLAKKGPVSNIRPPPLLLQFPANSDSGSAQRRRAIFPLISIRKSGQVNKRRFERVCYLQVSRTPTNYISFECPIPVLFIGGGW